MPVCGLANVTIRAIDGMRPLPDAGNARVPADAHGNLHEAARTMTCVALEP